MILFLLSFVSISFLIFFFFFQAEDGIRDRDVTGVQTCALPISRSMEGGSEARGPAPRLCQPGQPDLDRPFEIRKPGTRGYRRSLRRTCACRRDVSGARV